MTVDGVDRDRSRKRVAAQEALEALPAQQDPPPLRPSCEPLPPQSDHRVMEVAEALRIAGDAVVGVMPTQLPAQRSLLNGDIIKLFKDLRVTDSFLMKSKVREMLFRKPAAR